MAKNTKSNATKGTASTEAATGEIQYVKKISTKLFADSVDIGEAITIAGIANSYEQGESDKGAYLKFSGSFAAVGAGEQFRAGVLFVPTIAESILKAAIDEVVTDGKGAAQVSFAFDLIKKDSPDAILKYEWTMKPKLAPKENDSLTALLEGKQVSQKALQG